jgi:hypothetical protein
MAALTPAAVPPPAAPPTAVKRKQSGEEPMDTCPANWPTCTLCKKRKHLCQPPKGSKPPWTLCTACLHDGVKCVPAPGEEPVVASVYVFSSSCLSISQPLYRHFPSSCCCYPSIVVPTYDTLRCVLRLPSYLWVSGILTSLRMFHFAALTPHPLWTFFAGTRRFLLLSAKFVPRRSRMRLLSPVSDLLPHG